MRYPCICLLLLFIFSLQASAQTTYTFTGNGYWSNAVNWTNNTIPPNPLPDGSIIYISPATGDSCVLDVQQTIAQGGNLIIGTGALFVVSGGVVINNNIPAQPSTAICSQVWMTKNLAVSAYRNGDPIPEITNSTQWQNATTGAWCWYNNDSLNYAQYGKLYNWYAVNDPRGLAPLGWRIASEQDVNNMVACFGDPYIMGGYLKESGTAHWPAPNSAATNLTGFTALPGGYRLSGSFSEAGQSAFFWKSTEYDAANANVYSLYSFTNGFFYSGFGKKNIGQSVRCVKDTVINNTSLPTVTTNSITSITATTAVCGGNVANDGGYPVNDRGVVWSSAHNPVVGYNQTRDGAGTGSFTSNMANLAAGQTYYVRAYARNQYGNSYGNEVSFTTEPVTVPTVTTAAVTNIADSFVFAGGNVTSDGGDYVTERGIVFGTTPQPTTANNKILSGTGTGAFTTTLSVLQPNTTYYTRAYAINAMGTAYGNEMSFTTFSPGITGSVVICNQTWTNKNLTVSSYRNGDPIPQVTDPVAWGNLTTGAWCWYNNDSLHYYQYGKLYNWYAVHDPRGLAPTGWHIPDTTEWTVLANCLGGYVVAGGKMKDTGTFHWWSPNTGATNSSGFTGLPSGGCNQSGSYYINIASFFWSATEQNGTEAYNYLLSYTNAELTGSYTTKSDGASVRCVKDQ